MTLRVEIAILSDTPFRIEDQVAADILYEAITRVIDPLMVQFGAQRTMSMHVAPGT